MSENHYEVLGVDSDASRDELRDAYRARVDELTAARDRKGITESQLESNRDEVARVRTAWNVLSDPFQRQRYDAQVVADDTVSGDDVELVDDASERPEVQLTGWRRLMAPPPQKPAGSGASARGSSASNGAAPSRAKQPTIAVPAGMQIAPARVRGMAFLFDISIVLVIFYLVNLALPSLIQSDYSAIRSQITSLSSVKTAQGNINDANKAINSANQAIDKAQTSGNNADLKSAQSDLKSARSDLKSAQSDFAKAQKDYNAKQKDRNLQPVSLPHDTNKLQSMSDNLAGDIQTTTFVLAGISLVVTLAYLVPITAITGSTFGMKRRRLKVIRVDGSPVGWWPSFVRFLLPLLFGVVGFATILGILGPIVAFGIVLWGYRDANGQGVHDKLARTLVVET